MEKRNRHSQEDMHLVCSRDAPAFGLWNRRNPCHNTTMPTRSSKPRDHDFATVARRVVEQTIGEKLDGTPLAHFGDGLRKRPIVTEDIQHKAGTAPPSRYADSPQTWRVMAGQSPPLGLHRSERFRARRLPRSTPPARPTPPRTVPASRTTFACPPPWWKARHTGWPAKSLRFPPSPRPGNTPGFR
jgi:hypothetical protein